MPTLIFKNAAATTTFAPALATVTDVTFEVDGLASGAGRQSNQFDLGLAAVSRLYEWRAWVQFATAPVVGETVDIYLKTAGDDAAATTHPDNDDGTTDAAVSAEDKLRNLYYLGSIEVDEAVINIEMVASGHVEIWGRAVQVVFWNNTADGLTTDVNENGFSLTSVPDEIQD